MFVEKRKDREGKTYFSFCYYKDGKRLRLKKNEHPCFTDLTEAQAWAKSQNAFHSAQKSTILKKQSWRSKYYDFDELLKKYAKWQQDKAPNSWQTNVGYLENYIFDFFLNQKHANNVNYWHQLHQEFLDWVKHDAKTMNGKRQIAKNTANNIIKTLNTFVDCLATYHLIDPQFNVKCKSLPEHTTNKRTYKDIISKDEMTSVFNAMKSINPSAAEFFKVLWYTGMRFSELFGLPVTAMHKGDITNDTLKAELDQHRIKYYGYLYLDSQPFHDDRRREEDGSIKRKPLKSSKEISHRHARIIPIEDRDVWNILAVRFKQRSEEFLKRLHTDQKSDYTFFDDLEWNRAVNTLRMAYKNLGMTPKQYHCCRHSFVTYLVGRTRSFFLVRTITGHKKDKSFERYLHIYEQMAIESKAASQEIDVV